MKLERLSKNKIKYSISFEELTDKGFLEDEFESFIWHDLFDEMVEVAKTEYHVDVPDTISIEIFSLSTSEIVLILTIDELSDDEDLENYVHETALRKEMYYFDSIEDIISLSLCFKNLNHNRKTHLYKFEEKYYLLIENEEMEPLRYLIEEYGVFSNVSLSLIEEYGALIINDHALDVLFSYFNK